MAIKGGFGVDATRWKGGRVTDPSGYVRLKLPAHPRAMPSGYVYEHIVVAEAANGRPLPKGVEIHHVNGDKGNNANSNLVVCPDRSYHLLLHMRTAALIATGDPNARVCRYCGQYGDQSDIRLVSAKRRPEHRECSDRYARERRQKATAGQVASG